MRIAVTGGTGYLGTALRRALAERGDEAFAVRRGLATDPAAQWDPAAGWVRPGTFEGVDAVVHLSGTSIGAKRWTPRRRRELRASRIDSTRVLVDHLRGMSAPPRTLVVASAIGYYGDAGDRVLTEAAPRGEGFLADLVADWEAEADRAVEAGIRVVHTRFAPSISRHGELMERLLVPFRLGLGGPLGSGRQWFSWVGLDDVTGAIGFVLTHEEIVGAVNVVSPGAVTNLDFTHALGHALHRPTVFPVPPFALRVLFGRGLADEGLLASVRVAPARLLEAGYRFHYETIEDALQSEIG